MNNPSRIGEEVPGKKLSAKTDKEYNAVAGPGLALYSELD